MHKIDIDPNFEYKEKKDANIAKMHLILSIGAFFVAVILAIGVVVISAKILSNKINPPPPKSLESCGYTVIGYGKGIDCDGDTIPLVKNSPHGWRRANEQ